MPIYVQTSPLSLARLLWFYGEDELWPQALRLAPQAVANLAEEFGRLSIDERAVARMWPSAPRDAHLLLPTIKLLEGRPRPAVRNRRRPKKNMPAELDASEEQRWSDPAFSEVQRILHHRTSGQAD